MKDFFISYNWDDKPWAEWIAWQLEEAGYSVVFQAWDFIGNWLIKMDQAMRETARTIAVLSPNYINALYTHSEWANAFRLDPTGGKDLLIPVRVQPVDLAGVLAQIVYVDLVNSSESTAIELLLKRVRGERGKPTAPPIFPSAEFGREGADRHREVAAKPSYPAVDEDMKRLIRARELVVDWRGRHTGQDEAIHDAAKKARAWSRNVPAQFSDEVESVIELGARIAKELQEFPFNHLEFAQAYGLMVHPTVLWGTAMRDVVETDLNYGPGRSEEEKWLHEQIGSLREPLPDRYSFEMIARVLESAYALLRFNLDSLPRGFVSVTDSPPARDLGAYRTLLAANLSDDPRLHVLAAGEKPRRLATFAARKLTTYPLCARRNADGSVDLIAKDNQYLYWWSQSNPHPVMQYPMDTLILHASFLQSQSELTVVTVDSRGDVRQLKLDGRMKIVLENPGDRGFRSATLWIDPFQREHWQVLALTDECDLTSFSLKGSMWRSSAALWNEWSFGSSVSKKIWWQDNLDVSTCELEGLSCLTARRQAAGGEAIHFLDPISLVDIRQPLFIQGFVGDAVIASGRWLIVAFLQRGEEILPRLAVWDLQLTTPEAAARYFERNGDIYYPVVINQTASEFEIMFVLRPLTTGGKRQLCLFRWPEGSVKELGEYSELRMIRVD